MKNIVELLLLTALLLLVGCESETTGTVQGEDTGIATLVNELGNPVPNASVRVFKYRDSTGIYEDSVSTDENGEYKFNQKLPTGRYTIWAETDTTVMYREDLLIVPDSLFEDEDTLKPARKIWVPVKVQPNHNPQTVEAQIWGTPIRHNVTADGYLILDKITAGSYFTRLTTTLDGYTPTNDTIVITAISPDTLLDTLELIYTGIPVVEGLTYTYDTVNTTVNLTWNPTSFNDIQAYVIERKLKTETVWPASPLQLVYVSQVLHPITYSDIVTVGDAGAVYQYRIKIIDNSSLSGVPFGVLEVNAVSSSNAVTTITASSMQKAKAIVGNRASINDVMSFTVNFSNPTRKLTQLEWYEGEVLLKTTPLTELITSDSYEKSWPTIGAKNLTVKITDDAGFVWIKEIPVSIVEDKPVISFVDTTINLNVLDTLTAVVSDEFGEIVSYQWDWGNDGTIDAITPQFVKTQTEIEGGVPCKVTVTDDDGNVAEFVSGVTSELVWEKVGELPVTGFYAEDEALFFYLNGITYYYMKTKDELWRTNDGVNWHLVSTSFLHVDNTVNVKIQTFNGFLYILESRGFSVGSQNRSVLLRRTSDLENWELISDKTFTLKANGSITNYPFLLSIADKIVCNALSFPEGDIEQEIEIVALEAVDGEKWTKCSSSGFNNLYGSINTSWNVIGAYVVSSIYSIALPTFLRVYNINMEFETEVKVHDYIMDDSSILEFKGLVYTSRYGYVCDLENEASYKINTLCGLIYSDSFQIADDGIYQLK